MSNDLNTKLSEIKARAASATPGPWIVDPKHGQVISVPTGYFIGADGGQSDPEALFIANARQDIPALLRLVEVLREQRNKDFDFLADGPLQYEKWCRDADQAALEAMDKENV